jgi:hypothetical protein
MATLQDVVEALKHVADCTGRWTIDDFADYHGSLGLSPQQLDATVTRIRRRHPDLFAPTTGAPVTPPPHPPPAPPAPAAAAPPADGPSDPQRGSAADAMKNAEAALSHVVSAVADFDRHMIEAILHAHQTSDDGQRRLRELEGDIENAVSTLRLDTAVGACELQKYLIGKLREILAVVQDANDDNTSKQALAAAWAALYASQGGAGEPDAPAAPPAEPDTDDEIESYPDVFAADNPGPPEPPRAPAVPAAAPVAPPPMPSLPAPPAGLSPAGGPSGGPPVFGAGPGPQQTPKDRNDTPPAAADEAPPADPIDCPDDATASPEPDPEPEPEPEPAANPTTVTLPNGETVTAASPQLAAAIKAAAEGMPITDAFRQQAISIPPPGTPVAVPIEVSRVIAGDIGMFTDRQALAIGHDKALLDGQIQHITNVTGPSFLGWQHPPALETTAAPTDTEPATPTRPSATVAT